VGEKWERGCKLLRGEGSQGGGRKKTHIILKGTYRKLGSGQKARTFMKAVNLTGKEGSTRSSRSGEVATRNVPHTRLQRRRGRELAEVDSR